MDSGNFTVLTSAREFYLSLITGLKAATESVRIQMYCIEEDDIGGQFKAALINLAGRGVAVDLMYDSVGSYSTSNAFFDDLTIAGVNVVEFRPINPRKAPGPYSIRSMFRRNHRKLIIIDSDIYYLGGMNIGERFLGWEDITIRGQGEPVKELIASFDMVWEKRPFRPMRAPKKKRGQIIEVCDCRPQRRNYPVKRLYLSAIKKANERVWIAQAYFIPRRKLRKALARAARRGVDVRVIIPDRSDVALADLAAWPAIEKLVKHGVKIYRHQGAMMHSKFAVIDSHWMTVGTANLDSMSLHWNLELNLTVRDPEIIARFGGIFLGYENHCRLIERDEIKSRPWRQKILGRLLYYFSWIL